MPLRLVGCAFLGGGLGGASSLLLIAWSVPWLWGGKPAHPTPAGYAAIGVWGATCGCIIGAAMEAAATACRERWPAVTRPPAALSIAFVSGAVGAPFCIPFHAPIPLELDRVAPTDHSRALGQARHATGHEARLLRPALTPGREFVAAASQQRDFVPARRRDCL